MAGAEPGSKGPTRVADGSLAQQIARLERHGYLFGTKLTHSWSPFLHHVIYDHLDLSWAQIRLDSANLDAFLKLIQHPQFYGASVTMPNKIAILPHLDELTEECRAVGACNTLYLREENGQRLYCGANTDVVGIRESFLRNVDDSWANLHGRPALVIGGGGAARSAVYALRKWLGVSKIYLVNRDDAEVVALMQECLARGFGQDLMHVCSIDEVHRLEGPGAIVSCVPDLDPVTDAEKLARDVAEEFLKKETKGAVLEMCYNPSPFTRFGRLAEEKAWQVILGTEALIWQGLEQQKYWTGKNLDELPVNTVRQAIAQKLTGKSGARL